MAFAALLMPAVPSAAPPAGLAYDEIVRIVINATPPPPGNFQADVAALNAAQTAAAASPSPTPAPKKRGFGGIGSIVGAIAGGGNVAGAAGGAVANNAMDNAMQNSMQNSLGAQFGAMGAGFANFLQPHLMRYALWNGWERVEDVTAQTATIRKCDIGQVIQLNLAAKTYTIYTPSTEPLPTARPMAPGPGSRPQPAQQAQPGTAVATLDNTTTPLAPLKIEGEQTSGYHTVTSFSTTQATGSCHNGSASIDTLQYLAPLSPPAVTSCPVRPPEGLPETATPPTPGGCKPTFSMHRSGPTVPTGRLALYSLVSFGAATSATPPPGRPSSMGFLTERGNLKTLGPADAGLFGIPQGFTKTP